jgi:hypothetical protein
MPETLATVLSRLDSVTMSRVRTFYSCVDITMVLYETRTLTFQLTARSSLGVVVVQSATVRHRYRRRGTETVVRLTMTLPDEVRGQITRLESRVKDLLRPIHYQIDQQWRGGGGTISADICVQGESPCRVLNSWQEPVTVREWVGVAVVPVLLLKAVVAHSGTVCPLYEITTAIVSGDHDAIPDDRRFE